MKKQSKDAALREHGYCAYACGRGGQYALHVVGLEPPQSYRGTYKTKTAAIQAAMKLPAVTR